MVLAVEAQVDIADALRFLGCRGHSVDANLDETIERVAAGVNELQPRGLWRTFPIERVADEGVELEGTSFVLPGSHIARHLRGANQAALMAVTLGADSERLLKRSACISSLEGILTDACASSLVDEAANSMSNMIAEDTAARGLRAGKRFSPGYGNFPLSSQRDFLRAIDADKLLGIRLTEGDLMVPMKSVTAVVPLFEEGTDLIRETAEEGA